MNKLLFACCGLWLSLTACSQPIPTNSNATAWEAESLTAALHHPWSLAFLPDGDLLITERRGTLQRFNLQQRQLTAITGVPEVATGGQGGLFEVLLHPDYPRQPWLYFSYAKTCGNTQRTTAIGRARLQQQTLVDWQDIFVAKACGTEGQHFGGRMAFDDKGFLYLGIGDRGERQRAQNLEDHAGTVVRLKDDGSIPDDNPFVANSAVDTAIFTYGHRNPQGMIFHPLHRDIWVHEHGPRGGDEINRLVAGNNYGWPDVTYGREYYGPRIGVTEKDGTEPPLKYWVPSIAPSGFAFYQGDAFPAWQNSLLIGALAGQHLNRVTFEGFEPVSEERLLQGRARLRDVREGPEGAVYLLTDSAQGELIRLMSSTSAAVE